MKALEIMPIPMSQGWLDGVGIEEDGDGCVIGAVTLDD